MTGQLLFTAFLMGLAGSPHCAAMCGAGCGAAAQACAGRAARGRSLAIMMLGRATSYAAAGAIAAASTGAVRAASDVVVWLRPFWTMAQVAAVLLGLSLLWLGRQPRWLDALAVRVGGGLRIAFDGRLRSVPVPVRLWAAGALLVALPCGLLYSALVVAALASSPIEGAGVMLAFSVGGAVMLLGGPQLWWRLTGSGLRGAAAASDTLAIRMAGAALLFASAWAVEKTIFQPFLAWCGI